MKTQLLETCIRHCNKTHSINIEKTIQKRVCNGFDKIYTQKRYLSVLQQIEGFYNTNSLETCLISLTNLQRNCRELISEQFVLGKISLDSDGSYVRSLCKLNYISVDTLQLMAHGLKCTDPESSKILYFLDRNIQQELRYRKTFRRLLKITIKNIDIFKSTGKHYKQSNPKKFRS